MSKQRPQNVAIFVGVWVSAYVNVHVSRSASVSASVSVCEFCIHLICMTGAQSVSLEF